MNTERVNAKGRRVFKDSSGRTHVIHDGKKVYVKKLFTPKKMTTSVPQTAVPPTAVPPTAAHTGQDTGKLDAKKRRVFRNDKGRTHVIHGGKKVYVKKLFTPKPSVVVKPAMKIAPKVAPKVIPNEDILSGAENINMVNSKKRKAYKDDKDRTFVINEGKRVYVKKLFEPNRPPQGATPVPVGASKILHIWKQKTFDRIKPMKKKNYDLTKFPMFAPKVELKFNEDSGKLTRAYTETLFNLKTAIGDKLKAKIAIATNKNDIQHADWFIGQLVYLSKLTDHDILTAAAYTHHCHWWFTPFQRTGRIPTSWAHLKTDMITPLFPQFSAIINKGLNILKENANDADKRMIEFMRNKQNKFCDKYVAFTKLLRENAINKTFMKIGLRLYDTDLKRIVRNAPPAACTIVTYRGLEDDVFKGFVGKEYETVQFTSTSYQVQHALKYAEQHRGILKIITIPPGARVLFAAPLNAFGNFGEYEIMIPPSKYIITSRNKKKQIFNDLTGKFKYYRVTEVTMIP